MNPELLQNTPVCLFCRSRNQIYRTGTSFSFQKASLAPRSRDEELFFPELTKHSETISSKLGMHLTQVAPRCCGCQRAECRTMS
jgi:hypothetical protein